MKLSELIFAIIFLDFTSKGKAQQPPVLGTLAYLQSIVSNKLHYAEQFYEFMLPHRLPV